MKLAILTLLIAAASAGCDRPAPRTEAPKSAEPRGTNPAITPAPSPQPAPLPGIAVSGPSKIVGEWRVAGIDNRSLSQPFGIALSISPTEIRAVSQCVSFEWTYTLAEGRLATARHPSAVPPCLRSLSDDETDLRSAMDSAVGAYRLPSNALIFAGPAGSVTLFTQ